MPLAAMLAAVPAAAQRHEFTLVPEQSFVQFEVLHFGTSTTRGRFGPLQGQASLDRSVGRGDVSLRIATAGISTGIPVFDARLREPDLLASQDHPEAFFVARDFRFNGSQLQQVRGEFTFRGQSRPMALRALTFSCRTDSAAQREVCGGDFDTELLRSEFGATFGLPVIADRVRLLIQIEAQRPLP